MAADAIAEIKARINLMELISQYVTLRRSGRTWKGLCPFHSEKTPSFHVDSEKGFYRCYGCGAGGDCFSFLQEREGMSFVEAGELLARRAGVEWTRRGETGQQRGERQALIEVSALAERFFREQLEAAPRVRAYLIERGISAESVELFRIGFAPPGGGGLLRWLRSQRVELDEAEKANLILRDERGYRDRFIDRIIFPIHDAQGRPIAFGGRTVQPDGVPKYLNSRESLIFHKGRTLYGLHLARDAAREAGYFIAVEGYTDVIAMHQAGFSSAVAAMGTALTETQVALILRYLGEGGELLACYDSDSAGMTAALRGSAMFEQAGLEVRVVRLPPGEDPASLLKEFGPGAIREELSRAIPLLEYRIERVRSQYDLSDPRQRLPFAREAARAIAASGSALTRQEYGERLSQVFESLSEEWYPGDPAAAQRARQALIQEVRRHLSQGVSHGAPARSPATDAESSSEPAALPGTDGERYILRAALTSGEWAEEVAGAVTADSFPTPALRAVAVVLLEENGLTPAERAARIRDDPTMASLVSGLLVDPAPLSDEGLRDCLQGLARVRLHARWQELRTLLESGSLDLSGPEAIEYKDLCKRLTGRLG